MVSGCDKGGVDASLHINGALVRFPSEDDSEVKRQFSVLTKYLARKKHGASQDIYRLVGLLLIAFASIGCIAFEKETLFFTSVLTLILGILLDSPLAEKGVGRGGEGGEEGPDYPPPDHAPDHRIRRPS